jgi:hypothetical protein
MRGLPADPGSAMGLKKSAKKVSFKGAADPLPPRSSPQSSTTELEQAQKLRFAIACQAVGWGVNSSSLKAIEKGELLAVQLGHFVAPTLGSKASLASSDSDRALFSVSADGQLKSHVESKYTFNSATQFSAALASFVKAWSVLQPESDIQSLRQFQDKMVQLAGSDLYPLDILVDVWLSHKRLVQSRFPLFCWNDQGMELVRIQSEISAAVMSRMVRSQVSNATGKQGIVGIDGKDGKLDHKTAWRERIKRRKLGGGGPTKENAEWPCRFGESCTRIADGSCWYKHEVGVAKGKGKGGAGSMVGGKPS